MSGASPYSQSELSARLGNYRADVRPFIIFVMLYCVAFSVVLGAAMVLLDLPRRSEVFSIPFLGVTLALTFGPLFWVSRRIRRLQQKHGLMCAHCGKTLIKTSGSWLVRTGKCESCRFPLFVIESETESSANRNQPNR